MVVPLKIFDRPVSFSPSPAISVNKRGFISYCAVLIVQFTYLLGLFVELKMRMEKISDRGYTTVRSVG